MAPKRTTKVRSSSKIPARAKKSSPRAKKASPRAKKSPARATKSRARAKPRSPSHARRPTVVHVIAPPSPPAVVVRDTHPLPPLRPIEIVPMGQPVCVDPPVPVGQPVSMDPPVPMGQPVDDAQPRHCEPGEVLHEESGACLSPAEVQHNVRSFA